MNPILRRTLRDERRHYAGATVDRLVTLVDELDLRDSSAGRHSHTVAEYSRTTAVALGLDRDVVDAVWLAGLLHDIGKLGVREALLRKPGPLTEDEWAEMREHPQLGAELVEDAGLGHLGDWVRSHHERPDGEGYPRGLGDEDIALEARILAVADSYEAMTTDRVYRRAVSCAEARIELRRHAGTQFDEAVVEAFIGSATPRERVPR